MATDSKPEVFEVEPVEASDNAQRHHEKIEHEQAHIPSTEAVKVKLSWKTWIVVFISCFAYGLTLALFATDADSSPALRLRSSSSQRPHLSSLLLSVT